MPFLRLIQWISKSKMVVLAVGLVGHDLMVGELPAAWAYVVVVSKFTMNYFLANTASVRTIRNMKKLVFPLAIPALSLILTGCWTPPNANVQPPGEPRLIQGGVPASNNHVRAEVQSVDASHRVLNLKIADGTSLTCTVIPSVENFDQVQAGDEIKVALDLKLAVYVLKDGRLPRAGGKDEVIPFVARVQTVDPSYRLLKVQFLGGLIMEFKTSLDVNMEALQPGDAVVLQSVEATAVHIEKK